MRFHILRKLFLGLILAACAAVADAQTLVTDSAYHHNKYRYVSITLETGGGISFNQAGNGLLQVSFPYTSVGADSITSQHVFASGIKNINKVAKLYYLPFGVEIGTEKHFFTLYGTLFSQFGSGYSGSGGYGRIWNLPKEAGSKEEELFTKKWLLKSSVNVFFEHIDFDLHKSQLGSIDNDSRTIYALGETAGTTLTVTGSGRIANIHTYKAKNVDVVYSQSELSFVPQVTISSNPFRGEHVSVSKKKDSAKRGTKYLWKLSLGYKIGLYDWDGISFKQNDGRSNGEYVSGGMVSLKNPDLTVSYNGNTITKAPFRFSGLYLSLSFSVQYRGSIRK